MKCSKCGMEVPNDSSFCQYCGAQIPKVKRCAHCNAELSDDMRFCAMCGRSIHEGMPDPARIADRDEKISPPVVSTTSVEEPLINAGAPSAAIHKKKSHKRLLIIVVAIVVAIALAATIVVHIQSKKYAELKDAMSNVESYTELKKVHEMLESLLIEHGDSTIIREQYNSINELYQTIDRYASYSKTTKNSEIMRSSLEKLYRLDTTYPDWDLSGLLNSALKRHKLRFLYGKEWSCPWKYDAKYTDIFHWNENGIYTDGISGSGALDFEFTDIYYMDGKWTLILKDRSGETFILH